MKNVSQAAFTIIRKMQQNELTESAIYEAIAKFAKGAENKECQFFWSLVVHKAFSSIY